METAVPRLLAMLCILSVFIPAFIMAEPVRSLFVPLALAVGFAMISSYMLSSTLVPVLSVWLLKHHGQSQAKRSQEEHEGRVCSVAVQAGVWATSSAGVVAARWIVVPAYLVDVPAGAAGGRPATGHGVVSAGRLGRVRAAIPRAAGHELRAHAANVGPTASKVIDEEAERGQRAISMGFAGQQAPNYGMNNMILFMRGPDDGQMRVQLSEDSGVQLDELRERLRKVLPERIIPWFAEVLEREGPVARAGRRAARRQITFRLRAGRHRERGDELRLADADRDRGGQPRSRTARERMPQAIRRRISQDLRSLRDVQIQQTLDYPTVPITIDRQKAGLSGVTTQASRRLGVGGDLVQPHGGPQLLARSRLRASATRCRSQVPTQRMNSPAQVETIPLEASRPGPEPDGARRGPASAPA